MNRSRFSRAMYILAGAAVVIGGIVAIATNGRQFLPMLVVAVILATIGLLFDGKGRRG